MANASDFVVITFKEELMAAIHWHSIALIEGHIEQQEETLRKLEQAYTSFRYLKFEEKKDGQ